MANAVLLRAGFLELSPIKSSAFFEPALTSVKESARSHLLMEPGVLKTAYVAKNDYCRILEASEIDDQVQNIAENAVRAV